MVATRTNSEDSKRYVEFRKKIERLHQKEAENHGEDHELALYEGAYDNISSEIISYGLKADLEFIRIISSKINDEPNYVRKALINALGGIGRKRPESAEVFTEVLIKCFEDSDFGIRIRASNSLAEIAKRSAPKVVSNLISGVRSSDNLVREWSARSIGEIAKSDPTFVVASISHILPLLNDPDVGAAINAADALETMSKKRLDLFVEYVEQLRPTIHHENPNVSEPIRRMLTKLGKIEKDHPGSEAEDTASRPQKTSSHLPRTRRVFVVHGRDEVAKTSLEVFLYQIGLEPIVLHRQADEGMTVIEKFEKHSDVDYAFILLTPDEVAYLTSDAGKPDDQKTKEFRARPNVIFEFGYFVGKLGRSRVCCLYTGNVSLPSDVSGMIYKRYERNIEEVAFSVINDLKAAGYTIA